MHWPLTILLVIQITSAFPAVSNSDLSAQNQQTLVNSTSKNVVKIGHIGAINALPNYEKILRLARQELLHDGTLGDDFDVEIISRNGCGESFEGVAAAADMYHVENVRAFLGPYCSSEMVPVATMASYWNLPIIAYMATINTLSDKSIYKTLARVSIRSSNSIAAVTAATINHYGWKKVAFVSNTGASAYERIAAFEAAFKLNNITVGRKVLFEETNNAQDMVNSGYMEDIRSTSRIIIVLFSSTKDMTTAFREACESVGFSTSEYVFVFPWIQEGENGASPFVGSSSEMMKTVEKTYANCILIDDVNGFDDRLITPFMERLKSIGLGKDDIDLVVLS